jgi:hypothetical protein
MARRRISPIREQARRDFDADFMKEVRKKARFQEAAIAVSLHNLEAIERGCWYDFEPVL